MADGFMRRAQHKWHFVSSISTQAAPTIAEITGGDDLTPQVVDFGGWERAGSRIEDPDQDTAVNPQVPGEVSLGDCSISFRDIKSGTNPLRSTLAEGTEGYVVILPYGGSGTDRAPDTGDVAEVWPVEVISIPRNYAAGNERAMWRADFAITDDPSIDAAVA